MNTASPPALVAEGLAFSYASGGGLSRADLVLGAGSVAAVEGPSGAGKSTLLAVLGLILDPDEGTLHVGGVDTRALSAGERDLLRRRSIGIVLQDLGLLPFLNAWENVAAAFGPRLARHRGVARDLLGGLGMGEWADAPVTELSGGQRRRIAVARAAVKQPVLVLADEPTSGLDPVAANCVLDALRSCAERGAAVVVVTHDAAVTGACERRYVLDGGVLSEAGTGAGAGAREGELA
ncbi:ABC transporter ATP-binding protein [Streptomyces sp. bgisy022]|uniref:ABC transporter ATP-binding protein n=1 Tax=Streptomyces sp. bgisy022 TaxID=3413769 RepID=UPI003D735746